MRQPAALLTSSMRSRESTTAAAAEVDVNERDVRAQLGHPPNRFLGRCGNPTTVMPSCSSRARAPGGSPRCRRRSSSATPHTSGWQARVRACIAASSILTTQRSAQRRRCLPAPGASLARRWAAVSRGSRGGPRAVFGFAAHPASRGQARLQFRARAVSGQVRPGGLDKPGFVSRTGSCHAGRPPARHAEGHR